MMAEQYVLQPNGKWAVYSTVIDQLIAIECTEDDLVKKARDDAAQRAEADVRQYLIRKREGWGTQFSVTWAEAVAKTKRRITNTEFLSEIEIIDNAQRPD